MTEDALVERSDGFDYDLRMLCRCGLSSRLSASAYEEGSRQSRMTCEHCGESIHYGQAVAALRDPSDPALDDHALNSFAWYHTSTQPDWPSSSFASDFVRSIGEHDLLLPSREANIAEHTSKALHVGTYEAAIENMLRRMDDELDSHSQFYLYRVALRLEPGAVNPGFRDENQETASNISTDELERQNLSGVRYLNVHEAIGTLSLAVTSRAIRAVQSIPLPLRELTVPEDNSVEGFIRKVHGAGRSLSSAASDMPVAPIERRKKELGMLPDPTGAARRYREARDGHHDAMVALTHQLEASYLPHASAVVRRAFSNAAAHWHAGGLEEYVAHYRTFAALIERPVLVRSTVASRAWRPVTDVAASQ